MAQPPSARTIACAVLCLYALACTLVYAEAVEISGPAVGVIRDPTPKPPTFPTSFEATYVFDLPYVKTVQTNGLSFPVHLWYDGEQERMRIDVYGGLDKTIAGKDTSYLLYPRINTTVCEEVGGGVGPTLATLLQQAPLPDISEWQYAGTTQLGNTPAHMWQLMRRQQQKVSSYTFYTSPAGAPLRLYMMGYNILAGSHFDEYLLDFQSFKAGPIPDKVFEVPPLCKPAAPRHTQQQQQEGVVEALAGSSSSSGSESGGQQLLRAGLLMPWSGLTGGAAASNLLAAHPAAAARARQRASNLAFIALWNAAADGAVSKPASKLPVTSSSSSSSSGRRFLGPWFDLVARRAHQQQQQGASKPLGFKLAPNRYLDWLPEEYGAVATSLRRAKTSSSSKWEGAVELGEPSLPPAALPKHLDWRGTGADNIVKDQATCGSCWSFSATGTMQGAWYLASGQTRSFSEQQLVDCSWDYGNAGCGGGEMEPAIKYVVRHGGAWAEEDYQYLGQNAFCGQNATRRDAAPVAQFKGYGHVKKRSRHALKEALLRHGPVAISLDASQPTFKFYSHGVYSDPHCLTKRGELDHAVLVVGYGVEHSSGEEYWIVKNSWSKYWGEDGFIRMAATTGSGNDCGITSDPVVALVDSEAVAAAGLGMSREQRRAVYAAATREEWQAMEEVLGAWGL